MKRLRYPLVFILAAMVLTVGALAAYGRISGVSLGAAPPPLRAGDVVSAEPGRAFRVVTPDELEGFAAEDRAWREEHARSYTLAELRARGDGRRTPREAMQDRVYEHTRNGRRDRAIAELDTWLRSNPRDGEAMRSLARLLASAGRTDDAIRRYRELIALQERGRR